jgi:exodeoxyribonuclease VII large subunit
MPCSKNSDTQDLFNYIFTDPDRDNTGDTGVVYNKRKKPQSVSELTRRIRMLLEGTFENIWVEGEISNFKAHTSGHYYFTLKDEHSQIPAVMFRNTNWKLKFMPENGMLVVVTGSVQIYEPQGKYQIVCTTMEPSGVGALQIAFEQLKKKLAAEGLFDEERKKPLPVFPRTIGVVTSPSGAAIRDIINVLFRRFPACRLVVNSVPVQGEGAAEKIARAIEECNEINRTPGGKVRFDILIVGRGGGSMEDLWAFNEEVVARAIAASEIPVISAVGHEIDWTIADLAADRRAPTPSAAAEIVVQPRDYWMTRISDNVRRINAEIDYRITSCSQRVSRAITHYAFKEPLRMIDSYRQQVDEYTSGLTGMIREKLRDCAERVQLSRSILTSAGSLFSSQVSRSAEILSLRCRMLDTACTVILNRNLTRLDRCLDQLEALGPASVIRRGYTITRNLVTGTPVVSAGDIKPGDSIETEFRDGTAHSTVKNITMNPEDSDAG